MQSRPRGRESLLDGLETSDVRICDVMKIFYQNKLVFWEVVLVQVEVEKFERKTHVLYKHLTGYLGSDDPRCLTIVDVMWVPVGEHTCVTYCALDVGVDRTIRTQVV